MINFLKSLIKGKADEPESESAHQEPSSPKVSPPTSAAEKPPLMQASLAKPPVISDQPVQKVKRVRIMESEQPQRDSKGIDFMFVDGGPEVGVFQRGSDTYAKCPHCESVWNLKERLNRPSFRTAQAKMLTCPSCEKGVSIPKNLSARKLL